MRRLTPEMPSMKKYIFLAVQIAFTFMTGYRAESQDTIRAQKIMESHNNFIGITVTELPFVDFRLFYERKLAANHGIVFALGFKPAYKSFTDATKINLGQAPTAWCYRNTATWLYISAGYRYYLNEKKTFYASPELFYKYMWADVIVYTFGVGGQGSTLTNQYDLRSMTAGIAGLNLLLGKKFRIRLTQGFNMGFDIYTGLTIRYKMLNTTVYGSKSASRAHDEGVSVISIPLSENPEISEDYNFNLSIQFGINLYFSWF